MNRNPYGVRVPPLGSLAMDGRGRRRVIQSALPALFGSLGAWYAARLQTAADGDQITTLTDFSGNGMDLTRSASAAVTYQTGEVNGLPAVQFTGADGGYVSKANVALASISIDNEICTVTVLKQDSTQTNNGLWGWGGTDPGQTQVYATYSNTLYFDFNSSATGRVNVGQPTGWDDAWHILVARRLGNNQDIIVDGVTVVGPSSKTPGTLSGTNTLYLGEDRAASSGLAFKGFIAEHLMFKRGLQPYELAALTRWLGRLYGIAVTQP